MSKSKKGSKSADVAGIEVTPEMIEAGSRAAWHDPVPPEIARTIVERAYRAMEACRRAAGVKHDDHAAARLARRLYHSLKHDDLTAFVGRFQPGTDGVPPEHLDADDIDLLRRTAVDGSFNLVAIARFLLADSRLSAALRRAPPELDP